MPETTKPAALNFDDEESKQNLLKRYGIEPEQAKKWLEHLGFTEEYWDELLAEEDESHELRAFVKIAKGTSVELLEDVYSREREYDVFAGQEITGTVSPNDLRAQTQRL